MKKNNIALVEQKPKRKAGRPKGSTNKIKNNNILFEELINKLMEDNKKLLIKNTELNIELELIKNKFIYKLFNYLKLI